MVLSFPLFLSSPFLSSPLCYKRELSCTYLDSFLVAAPPMVSMVVPDEREEYMILKLLGRRERERGGGRAYCFSSWRALSGTGGKLYHLDNTAQ